MAVPAGENLSYVKDLIKRYEAAISAIKKTNNPHEITVQERKLAPVLAEIQIAIPRIWDDFVRVARKRRQEIREEADANR